MIQALSVVALGDDTGCISVAYAYISLAYAVLSMAMLIALNPENPAIRCG
jgi:hypothetical protein